MICGRRCTRYPKSDRDHLRQFIVAGAFYLHVGCTILHDYMGWLDKGRETWRIWRGIWRGNRKRNRQERSDIRDALWRKPTRPTLIGRLLGSVI